MGNGAGELHPASSRDLAVGHQADGRDDDSPRNLDNYRITDADRRWADAVKYYVENQDENLPPEGRFNYGQKLFFWLMFFGIIVLLISGFGLWFVEDIPWSLRWLRYLSVALHVAAALATIGGFIIHVYMGTAMVRGGFTSIIRGEVSTKWAKTHHRLWYEQITGGKDREDARRP